jgi:8-oxo-dGTP diphosphatase
MIVENKNGHRFLEFIRIGEDSIEDKLYAPLTHSLAVIKHRGKVLLVFDKWKKVWELPGGSIEKDETPRECIVRELKEESGQQAEDLVFNGLMKFQLKPDDRIEYGALYSGTISAVQPFSENPEIKEILFLDKNDDIAIDAIDERLIGYGMDIP